jgi:hypothetical protein
MVYNCPLCLLDPLSHSLNKFLEKDNTIYFYTCPAKAKLYFDTNSIINHYDGVLSEIPENKHWVWVFDGMGFGLEHFLQIQVAIELSSLISSKFSKNLKKIVIINSSNYISSIYNIIKPFLNNNIKSIIEISYKIKSTNDFIFDGQKEN